MLNINRLVPDDTLHKGARFRGDGPPPPLPTYMVVPEHKDVLLGDMGQIDAGMK